MKNIRSTDSSSPFLLIYYVSTTVWLKSLFQNTLCFVYQNQSCLLAAFISGDNFWKYFPLMHSMYCSCSSIKSWSSVLCYLSHTYKLQGFFPGSSQCLSSRIADSFSFFLITNYKIWYTNIFFLMKHSALLEEPGRMYKVPDHNIV